MWCLTPFPTIFMLYPGDEFYWRRKPEYPKKKIDLSQVTDELYHIILFEYTSLWAGFELTLVVIYTYCTGKCKSKYHTTTTTTHPLIYEMHRSKECFMWSIYCIYNYNASCRLILFFFHNHHTWIFYSFRTENVNQSSCGSKVLFLSQLNVQTTDCLCDLLRASHDLLVGDMKISILHN